MWEEVGFGKKNNAPAVCDCHHSLLIEPRWAQGDFTDWGWSELSIQGVLPPLP